MSDAPPIDGIFLQAKKENSRPAFKTDISGGRFKLLGNIPQVRDELPGQIAPVFLAVPACALPLLSRYRVLALVLFTGLHRAEAGMSLCARQVSAHTTTQPSTGLRMACLDVFAAAGDCSQKAGRKKSGQRAAHVARISGSVVSEVEFIQVDGIR